MFLHCECRCALFSPSLTFCASLGPRGGFASRFSACSSHTSSRLDAYISVTSCIRWQLPVTFLLFLYPACFHPSLHLLPSEVLLVLHHVVPVRTLLSRSCLTSCLSPSSASGWFLVTLFTSRVVPWWSHFTTFLCLCMSGDYSVSPCTPCILVPCWSVSPPWLAYVPSVWFLD